jgi:penicillin-binding protein 1A
MLFTEKPSNNIVFRIIQKLKEWVIATRLERAYTKNEILTMYFNKFDFINQAAGIHQASQIYFNTTPKNLKLEEAALLVGMFKNPSLFNPKNFAARTKHRRNVVLAQMMRNGELTKEEFDETKKKELVLSFSKVRHNAGLATYFRSVLSKDVKHILYEKNLLGNYKLQKEDGTPYNIYRDGLKIYTTIDVKLQKYAEDAMKVHLKSLQKTFEADIKKNKYWPFRRDVSKQQYQAALIRYMKQSDRYKTLTGKRCGGCGRGAKNIDLLIEDDRSFYKCDYCEYEQMVQSEDDITKVFNTKTTTKLFSWDGDLEKKMTPMDSILYHNSLLHAGFVAIEPKSGFVKAWVGGINKKYFSYDHVRQSKRQVGSTIKPLLYALAIQAGLDPCDEIPNAPYVIPKGKHGLLEEWSPSYGPRFKGMINYKFGLANSMNNVAARLIDVYGPEQLLKLAKSMGIESEMEAVVSLALGTSDASLLEMVGAFTTFANEGVWNKPEFLLAIEDKNGKVLYQVRPEMRAVLSDEAAYTTVQMMKGVIDGVYDEEYGKKKGTSMSIRKTYGIKPPLAGKTGTTQNSTDGWFIGMSPDLVAGVWVGAEDRNVSFNSGGYGQGAYMALPIWARFMQKVYKDESIGITTDDFAAPNGFLKSDLDCSERDVDDQFR